MPSAPEMGEPLVETDPVAARSTGTTLKKGSDVHLVVSKGVETFPVPALEGTGLEEAREQVETLGLELVEDVGEEREHGSAHHRVGGLGPRTGKGRPPADAAGDHEERDRCPCGRTRHRFVRPARSKERQRRRG